MDPTQPDLSKTDNFVTQPDPWMDLTHVQLWSYSTRRIVSDAERDLLAIAKFFLLPQAFDVDCVSIFGYEKHVVGGDVTVWRHFPLYRLALDEL